MRSGRPRSVPRPWHLLILALVFPPLLHAAGGDAAFVDLLLIVAAMLAAGKLLGEGAERLGYPSVLGELLAGLLIGPSVLGIVPAAGTPSADTIRILAELGVILLLFEVGLETELKEMFKVGRAALAVALVGLTVPFALGYGYWVSLPHPSMGDGAELGTVAIFIGATLTATSVGITARVLADLNQMETPEARIILGAAVIDDVVGLVILSVVSGLAAGGSVSAFGVANTLLVAVGFLVVAVLVGNKLMPSVADRVTSMRVRGIVVTASLAFALTLAALAAKVGSALIIGAFAAGLILRGTRHAHTVEEQIRPVAAVLAPIFFVSVGAAADVRLLDPRQPGAGSLLLIAAVLTLLAVGGKMVAGWAAPWLPVHRATIGAGMVPRGEVGLIFADVGRSAGLLSAGTFNAVLIMVMATTFLGPLLLKLVIPRPKESG